MSDFLCISQLDPFLSGKVRIPVRFRLGIFGWGNRTKAFLMFHSDLGSVYQVTKNVYSAGFGLSGGTS